LFDAYAWHQTLWHAFPGMDGKPRNFLTRVDRRGDNFEALILSPEPPEPQPWGQWDTKPIAESFFQHERYRFSLRANPTQMRVVRDAEGNRRKHGRRTGVFDPVQLRQWVTRRLQQAGCRIEVVSFDPPVRETFCRKGKTLIQVRVDFRGVLRVVDRHRFVEAAVCGIGRARAFGFGMLLLAPLS